ncbi:MAG: class I SAM-dependent RNA methyltransferase [Longimicrobiales bacterium]
MTAEALQCFAIAAPGLERLVAAELGALGCTPTITQGGVEFTGNARLIYEANLRLRVASRILVRIASFRARTFHELERHAQKIPWRDYLARNGVIALRVTARKSKLYHEGAIAERLMTAIEKTVGPVQPRNALPDDEDAMLDDAQMFVVRFVRDECVVSVDSSGALLHRRGYRQAVAKAPLRETLAAAMLLGSDWDASAPLVDPMCGSGTIAIEAALIARRIAPGIANLALEPRAYAFQGWPGFDARTWSTVVENARADVRPNAGVVIHGSDRDAGAITAAHANASRAGVTDDVVFEKLSLSAANIPAPAAWLVTNPPYGVRVGSGDQRDLYAAVGRVAKEMLTTGRVVLLTPEPLASRQTGLPLETLFETRNGGITVRLLATPEL